MADVFTIAADMEREKAVEKVLESAWSVPLAFSYHLI